MKYFMTCIRPLSGVLALTLLSSASPLQPDSLDPAAYLFAAELWAPGQELVPAPEISPFPYRVMSDETGTKALQPLTNNACEIVISNVDPGCSYDASTNQSTYDVVVTVDWEFNDLTSQNELIEVSFEGQTLTIDPASQATGSGTVTFNGVSGPVQNEPLSANFATSDCCLATSLVDLVSCVPACGGLTGNDLVGGNVFLDSNNNGSNDNGETGQENVLVRVYDCEENVVCEVFTNSDGSWCCDNATNGETFRVEYTTPFNPALEESLAGPDNGTSTQFLVGGTSNSSYAVTTERVDCEGAATDFDIVITCFARGDNINGPHSDDGVVLANPYLERDDRLNGSDQDIPERVLARADQVGSVYGVAVSPPTGDIFVSAYIKRFAGLGAGDVGASGATGAIYRIQPDGTVDVLIDISPTSSSNPDPSLYSTGTTRNNADVPAVTSQCDPAFNEIGRVGWGDIDISADGEEIYGMNMFDKSLYVIDSSGTIVSRNPIPGTACGPEFTGCTNNPVDLRPMATAYNPADGLVYIGVVCSGESLYDLSTSIQTAARAALEGYVFTFDPVTSQYSDDPVLTFPLTPGQGYTPGGFAGGAYHPWIPANANPATLVNNGFSSTIRRGFPILSDIEFDGDALIIGTRDLQRDRGIGNNVPTPDGMGNCTSTNFPSQGSYPGAGGLILRACPDGNGDLMMEVNGVCGGVMGYGLDNKPGDENRGYNTFYEQNTFHPNSDYMGSIALLPGQGEIAAPGNVGQNATGVYYIDNETIYTPEINNAENDYDFSVIYNLGPVVGDGNFSKSAGLGDIEVLCTRQPMLQIGNYAWIDEDADGLQDACEPPLSGLTVKLYDKPSNGDAPSLLATTMTNAAGNYYFTGPNSSDGATWESGVADDVLQRDEAYLIVFCGDNGFDATAGTLEVDDRILCLSPTDATEPAGINDQNDSDASVMPVGSEMLPAYCAEAGQLEPGANHTFDTGFKPILCPEIELQALTVVPCSDETIPLTDLVVTAFRPDVIDYVWSSAGDGSFVDANGDATTDYASAVGYVPGTQDGSDSGVTLILTADPASYAASCDPASEEIFVSLQNADCGDFPWGGND